MILLTGGTGTLGRAIMDRIRAEYDDDCPFLPAPVAVVSRDEEKQRQCRAIYRENEFYICDVRDREALRRVFEKVQPSAVIHLAALKQCPMGEDFPLEHVKTNVIGTDNVASLCKEYQVQAAVMVSTDKACEPVSVYGATKLIAERIFTAAGYSVIRCGNIMGSRGSITDVVNEASGPIPVTDPNMTRFYISASEAAKFVLDRLDDFCDGEVYVPKGMDAKSLRRLIGDNPFHVVGRRPGEKLHETAVSADEAVVSARSLGDYFTLHRDGDTRGVRYCSLDNIERPRGFYNDEMGGIVYGGPR